MALFGAGQAFAQEPRVEPRGTPPQQQANTPQQLDVARLPIDVERIRRELRQSGERQTQDGLNVEFQIDVFGRAPSLQLFTEADNLTTGPVPYGGPTHQQMLEMMTPKEFSSPTMDFNALFRWLMEKTR